MFLSSTEVLEMHEAVDRAGWAFACGFTVIWSPTRGRAKRAWYQYRTEAETPAGALGPKPEPTSLAEAIEWGQGRFPSYA